MAELGEGREGGGGEGWEGREGGMRGREGGEKRRGIRCSVSVCFSSQVSDLVYI